MHPEKVVFAFFIVLAFTINFAFFMGDISDPSHHQVYELFAAIVVNLIATILKFGERSQIGAVLLATSLVADLQLIIAALIWGWAEHIANIGLTPGITASIVSLAGAAMMANVISVVLLVVDTVRFNR